MGTDIHGVFQRCDAGFNWVDVPSDYDQNRHYQLFAVLAGVRNGTGFAGARTGGHVTPIALPRGLPADFVVENESHTIPSFEHFSPMQQQYRKEGDLNVWMGDHSHSWLSGGEILAWAANAPVVVKTGVLDRTTYEKWDRVSCPENYSGGVMGRDVVVINDNDIEKASTPSWTHIQCDWDSSLREELSYFFDEVRRLVDLHGDIRFVFGFDS